MRLKFKILVLEKKRKEKKKKKTVDLICNDLFPLYSLIHFIFTSRGLLRRLVSKFTELKFSRFKFSFFNFRLIKLKLISFFNNSVFQLFFNFFKLIIFLVFLLVSTHIHSIFLSAPTPYVKPIITKIYNTDLEFHGEI